MSQQTQKHFYISIFCVLCFVKIILLLKIEMRQSVELSILFYL